MTRVLAFPHVGNLQVHSTTPRLDLTRLRHNGHTQIRTSYTYKSPKVYLNDDEEVENNYAVIGALDFFRERMWLSPSTCIRVEAKRELVHPSRKRMQKQQWATLEDASKVGILIVSQKNISGGYYTFASSFKSSQPREIRTNITPGQMVFFEQSHDNRVECTVSPMEAIDYSKVGIRYTLVFSVAM